MSAADLLSACAAPQQEKNPDPLLALLIKCQPENKYVKIATSTHEFVVVKIHSESAREVSTVYV